MVPEETRRDESPGPFHRPHCRPRYLGLIAALILVIAALIGSVSFYRKYLAGMGPALTLPWQGKESIREMGATLAVPPEFQLSIFAEGLTTPRVIAFDPAGTMLVSMTAAGKVVALPDDDRDGRADRIITVAEGLHRPHGLAFRCPGECRLYVGETDRVTLFTYDRKTRTAHNGRTLFALPGGGRHATRTLLFLPPPRDNALLVSVGSSCDVCTERDWRRAKILVGNAEGGELHPFASGLRNAVFMRLHPGIGEVWATEMGRDFLGDDLPPDEINIIREGRDYGWPFCFGQNLPDWEFSTQGDAPCRDKTPSYLDIPAHSSPLGLDFFPADWPEKYQGNLLVAFHGSWNRSVPTGYKISLFRFAKDGAYLGQEDFVTGWLRADNSAIGRPVDIRIRPAGTIFISDDKAGVIYRLALRRP